ncbi:MAG: haloacid dehalogenase-like hydrolase [Bacteroidetes bacterium]|nr:haloacid dehalogenase-like hydrolase [Bacteroidota bacterium]
MKKRIAFFDFDGTITTKDTLLEIIKFQKGAAFFYIGFILYAPILIAFKLKIVSNSWAKQQILKFFFGNNQLQDFQTGCDLFVDQVLPKLIRPKAIKEISKLQQLNADVVIVSASAGNWIKKWTDQLGVQLISTILEYKNQKVTGRFEGKNCHGIEKVNRIKAIYDLAQYDEVYCYGDTSGDKPMLSIANISFFKPFR